MFSVVGSKRWTFGPSPILLKAEVYSSLERECPQNGIPGNLPARAHCGGNLPITRLFWKLRITSGLPVTHTPPGKKKLRARSSVLIR